MLSLGNNLVFEIFEFHFIFSWILKNRFLLYFYLIIIKQKVVHVIHCKTIFLKNNSIQNICKTYTPTYT